MRVRFPNLVWNDDRKLMAETSATPPCGHASFLHSRAVLFSQATRISGQEGFLGLDRKVLFLHSAEIESCHPGNSYCHSLNVHDMGTLL